MRLGVLITTQLVYLAKIIFSFGQVNNPTLVPQQCWDGLLFSNSPEAKNGCSQVYKLPPNQYTQPKSFFDLGKLTPKTGIPQCQDGLLFSNSPEAKSDCSQVYLSQPSQYTQPKLFFFIQASQHIPNQTKHYSPYMTHSAGIAYFFQTRLKQKTVTARYTYYPLARQNTQPKLFFNSGKLTSLNGYLPVPGWPTFFKLA